MSSIFTKIISGEIPSHKLHEDSECIVILDIAPIRKGHSLIISKTETPFVSGLSGKTFSKMAENVQKLSSLMREKLPCDAVNVLINDGKEAGQEVPHCHIHLIPRKANDGILDINKKEKYSENEIQDLIRRLSF